MPVIVRFTKAVANPPSVGRSRRGKIPVQAMISQIAPTTTKGKMLRQINRRRSLPCDRSGAMISSDGSDSVPHTGVLSAVPMGLF